ncbi:MAG: hypothetical protein IT292_05400 [Deltaproteobacteria bacterium]|nr:hypothetical protein [Deltaproteobacteria bacterium]
MANRSYKSIIVILLIPVFIVCVLYLAMMKRAENAKLSPASGSAAASAGNIDVETDNFVSSDEPMVIDETQSATGEYLPEEQGIETIELDELPPELAAQINAEEVELPPDIAAQVNAVPEELPEDLLKQVESQDESIPEDIQQALESAPEITADENMNSSEPAMPEQTPEQQSTVENQ